MLNVAICYNQHGHKGNFIVFYASIKNKTNLYYKIFYENLQANYEKNSFESFYDQFPKFLRQAQKTCLFFVYELT